MRIFYVVLMVFYAFPVYADMPQKIHVVASFSILGDMVKNIAGDAVELTVLVGPDADTHVYEPTPSDMKAIAGADVVIMNGLGFENWMDRLLKSAGYTGHIVVAANGIAPLEFKGDGQREHGHIVDPHAWQTAKNGIVYIKNICDGLSAVDRVHAAIFIKNAKYYSALLAAIDARTREAILRVPFEKRTIITSHDAFGHFAQAYGVRFIAPLGVSTDSEATAGGIARLIDQIRAGTVKALFLENITDKRLIEQLSQEGGAFIGGTLYSDALSKRGGSGDSYIKMLENNEKIIIEGMQHNLDKSAKIQ